MPKDISKEIKYVHRMMNKRSGHQKAKTIVKEKKESMSKKMNKSSGYKPGTTKGDVVALKREHLKRRIV